MVVEVILGGVGNRGEEEHKLLAVLPVGPLKPRKATSS